MKIQCDVCEKEEASIFCTADEAALCEACNHHVHDANKLAGKHLRFPLLRPPLKQYPHCDICQERRAFVFCKEDRAILCRECDSQIHRTNQHTQKHSRFLLTGVTLSTTAASYQSCSSSPSASASNVVGYHANHHRTPEINSSPTSDHISWPNSNMTEPKPTTSPEGSLSDTSSISEYLTQTLPGWHVEDFLDHLSSGFCT
ncbi:PREDICTED: B-box zinc finger protein 20-like [Ipomoea nil]|uniref:B-box zinc finger protein 20-like n=1 Tax=Ipomoea nil TaxID=35883 RepID=UPI000901A28F|nr:PREDICTED: B-box zinc finger protein 20-like [Ipomoea nil]